MYTNRKTTVSRPSAPTSLHSNSQFSIKKSQMIEFLLFLFLVCNLVDVRGFVTTTPLRRPLRVAGSMMSSKADVHKYLFQPSMPIRTLRPEQDVPSEPPKQKPKSFEWTKQWYPIAVETYTDKKRPHKMQLLGNDVVLWFDGKQWRLFDDSCPHRGVPLSEGRVEKNGEFMCAYHAWRFDGDGKCTSIPQSRTKEKEEALKANTNSCVRSYPTQVAQGLIWCWGEMGLPGSDVTLEAALKAPQLIEELSDPQYAGRTLPYKWNFRDLPYGWDFFMENTLDPAHVAVSHHGVAGNRYVQAVYMNVTRVPSKTEIPASEGGLMDPAHPEDAGFNFIIGDAADSTQAHAYNDFRPPCLNKIERCGADGSKLILALYATPTRPGYCRHIGAQMLIKSTDNKSPPGLGMFSLPMPAWLMHLTASLFLHQDQVFLHHQERNLYHTNRYAFGRFPPNMFSGFSGPEAASESGGPKKSVGDDLSLRNDPKSYAARHFTPNEHDLGISKLRQWIHRAAAGGPVWGSAALAQGLPPVLPPEQLFDVYHSHVASCTVCLDALRRTKNIRDVSMGIVFLTALFFHPLVNPYAGAVAGACGLTAVAAHKLMKMFYLFEYNHQDNN